MKKILFISFFIFIQFPVQSQDETSWIQYWKLSQQITSTEDENQIKEIALQQIKLLHPIYTSYKKGSYDKNRYGKICIALSQAYSLSGQYQYAKNIVETALKRIRNNNQTNLRLTIERIKIISQLGNYDEAELLLSKISPIIHNYIPELQNDTNPSNILDSINIIINYDLATSILRTYYINKINRLIEKQGYQKTFELLQQKESFFTSILLSNTTIDRINKYINNISPELFFLDSCVLKQDNRIDAKVFYYTHLASCYTQLGQYSEALKYYYLAEQHCVSTDSISTSLIAHNYLMTARYLRQIDNILRAEQYYARCINICAQSDDKKLIRVMNYAAMERAALIASEGGITEARECVKILLNYYLNKNQFYTIDFLDFLFCAISVVEYEKDYNEALQLSKQALEIIPHIKDIDDPSVYTTKFRNKLASSYIHLQQYENAFTTINDIKLNDRTSNSYWIKGFAEKKLGLYKNAIQSWQKSLQLQNENDPITNRLNTNMALLTTAIDSNTPIETRLMADDFISQMHKAIPITTPLDFNQILPIYQIYYQLFLLYYSTFDTHADVAYNLAINLKGVALKSTQEFKNHIYTTQNRKLINQFENLQKLRKELLQTTAIDSIKLLKNQIYNLEQNLLIEANIRPSFTTWKDIQGHLNQNTAVIEFVDYMSHQTDQYAALILRRDWESPKMIPLCSKEDLEQVARLSLENEKWRKNSYARKNLDTKYFRNGYSLIWSKLEPYINEGDNVYFSPSGLLHQINLEVLKDSTGRQANEKYNLFRISSTRQLCFEKPNIKYTNATLYGGLVYEMDSTQMVTQSRSYHSTNNYIASRGFVADSSIREGWKYLPSTKSEVDMIARQMYKYHIQSNRYTETVGTEESFKALSGKHIPIIHLATHGFFFKNEEAQKQNYFEGLKLEQNMNMEDNSLKRSGLILAGGQRAWLNQPIPSNVEDGILLAEEIATLDLSGTDLVVLSACQTGLGEITSEGVFGLQRAFKQAGVQTLIMSLWRVNDTATSLMMQIFYEELLSGKSKREAFVIAQQTVKEKYIDPYYWAAFIMLD